MLGEELSLAFKGVIRDYLIQKKASGDLLEVEFFELKNSVVKSIFKGVEVQRTTKSKWGDKCFIVVRIKSFE